MKRIRILHRTYYTWGGPVTLGTHLLRLRPREGHQLRIESSKLTITPAATISWRGDVEGNSIATAEFAGTTTRLAIESELVVQQFNENPFDFLVADHAVDFPFAYETGDWPLLAPYAAPPGPGPETDSPLARWVGGLRAGGEAIQTVALLLRIAARIQREFRYGVREEAGVQSPETTLALGSGSCRDFAALYIAAARHLGLAARFVSGYLHAPPSYYDYGSTHAWAEVYVPGAGWKGVDPTLGLLTGPDHIPVAVGRLPDSVPPIAGSFTGIGGASMSVGVWLTAL